MDFVASHGHTIFHEPENGYSCQIGAGAPLTAHAGIPAIVDFRSGDIALGGQGAPLAPLADNYLFPDHHYFLNLGGIANLSVSNSTHVAAYDICGCNQILNFYARHHGEPYDDNGRMAASGRLRNDVIQQVNDWPYYVLPYPKSLDNSQVLDLIDTLSTTFNYSSNDMLHTMTQHIAMKISDAFVALYESDGQEAKILVTGGGAHNSYLIEQLNERLSSTFELDIPSAQIINFKEAMLMALAGLRRLQGQPIFDNSLTGAERSVSGGGIYVLGKK